MASATVVEYTYDFFISRRGGAAAVAQEVANVLEEAGYKTIVQDFDIAWSTNFIAAIHDAVKKARHFIGILTEDYDTSPFTRAEWTSFFAASARAGGDRRLVVLRVDEVEPPGLLAPIVYGDLFGVSDPERRREVILRAAEGRSAGKRHDTRVVVGAPPRNPDFTGRDALLHSIHHMLSTTEGPAVVTQAAIHGLGGVGKTSLAVEYLHRYLDDYAGALWAPAETRTALTTSLASLAAVINPQLAVGSDFEKTAMLMLSQLPKRSRPWLLVYDNVGNPRDIGGLIPGAGARVLITTRFPDWGGVAEEVQVDVLEPDVAVEFLLKRASRSDRKDAARLAAVLGYLPLALDHAGAYIKLTGGTFERYVQRLEDLISKAPKGAPYPDSVEATFNLAIEKAVDESPAADELLGLLAVLAPERVPVKFFDTILTEQGREDALTALSAVSLIKHDPFLDRSPAIRIHRLVRLAARKKFMTRGSLLRNLETATEHLIQYFPEFDDDDAGPAPAYRQQFVPHVLAICDEPNHGDMSTTALSSLLSIAGDTLISRGEYQQAEPLLREALAIDERRFGRNHPSVGTALNNLACLLYATNRESEADSLFREALSIEEATFGSDHPRLVVTLHNLGNLLFSRGHNDEAENLYRKIIAICDASPNTLRSKLVKACCSLAGLLVVTGRRSEALPFIHRASEILIAVLKTPHPDNELQWVDLRQFTLGIKDRNDRPPLLFFIDGSLEFNHPLVKVPAEIIAAVLDSIDHHESADELRVKYALKNPEHQD